MVRRVLYEIEGRWRWIGTNFTSDGKADRTTSWQHGFAKLRHSQSSGMEWTLCNLNQTIVKTMKTTSDDSQIDLMVNSTRFRVRYEGNGFVIIPKCHIFKRLDIMLVKIREALASLDTRSNIASDELFTPEAALESIFNDDDDNDYNHREEPIETSKGDARLYSTYEHTTPRTTPTSPTRRSETTNKFYSKSSTKSRLSLDTGMKHFRKDFASKSLLSEVTASPTLSKVTPTAKRSNVLYPYFKKGITEPEPVVLSDSDDAVLPTPRPQGFSNLGNTCYMNVIWQSLISLDTFTADLLYSYKKYETSLKELSLLRCLSELVQYKISKQQSLVEQKILLKKTAKAVAASAAKYDDFRQHDAHEFFGEVIDIIKEETTSQDTSCPPSEHSSINATVDNFEFELERRLDCTSCGHTTSTSEVLNGLTVNIPEVYLKDSAVLKRKAYANVQDALDSYFQSEVVEYLCELCGASTFNSHLSFKRVPRVLVVVVKRYDSTRYDVKVQSKLAVNRNVTLSDHCSSYVRPASAPNIPVKLSSPNVAKFRSMQKTPSMQPAVAHKASEASRRSLSQAFNGESSSEHPFSAKKKLPSSISPPKRSPLKQRSLRITDDGQWLMKPRQHSKPLMKTPNLSTNGQSAFERKTDNCVADADNSIADKSTVDADLSTAIALSRKEALSERKRKIDADLYNPLLTEDQELEMAIAQSLKEGPRSTSPTSPTYKFTSLKRPQEKKLPLTAISHNRQHPGLRGGAPCPSIDKPSPKLRHSPIVDQLGQLSQRQTDAGDQGSAVRADRLKEADDWSSFDLFDDEMERSMIDIAEKEDDRSQVSLSGTPNKRSRISLPGTSVIRSKVSLPGTANKRSRVNLFGTPDRSSKVNLSATPDERPSVSSPGTPDKGSEVVSSRTPVKRSKVSFPETLDHNSEVSLHDTPDKMSAGNWTAGEYGKSKGYTSYANEKENRQPGRNDLLVSTPTLSNSSKIVRSFNELKKLQEHEKNGTELGYSYKLVGIVSHIGSSSAHGHYINDVYNIKEDLWLSYDDSDVTVTDVDEVCSKRAESGYLYFYMDRMVIDDIR